MFLMIITLFGVRVLLVWVIATPIVFVIKYRTHNYISMLHWYAPQSLSLRTGFQYEQVIKTGRQLLQVERCETFLCYIVLYEDTFTLHI